jgi:condensin complex subunit 3
MTKFSLSLLASAVPAVFDQVQHSSANHQKNAVALYKLQLKATSVVKSVKGDAAMKLIGEKAFGDAFIDMISRILVVKKGIAVADRVVKFIGTYIKFMTGKGAKSVHS